MPISIVPSRTRETRAEAYYAFSTANALRPTAYAAARVDAGKGKESSLCGAHVDFKGKACDRTLPWP